MGNLDFFQLNVMCYCLTDFIFLNYLVKCIFSYIVQKRLVFSEQELDCFNVVFFDDAFIYIQVIFHLCYFNLIAEKLNKHLFAS